MRVSSCIGAARLLGASCVPRTCARYMREEIKRGELAGESLGRGHADLRAGVGVDGAGGFARDHRADDVADGQRLRSFGFGFALRGDGVGGLAGLRNHQRDRVRIDDGIAVAPFAGVVHFDRNARQRFDHELAGQPGVPTGAAGDDVDLACSAELGLA